MTIEIISIKIIQELRLLPVDQKQKISNRNLSNFWEQYKEQLQFQLYLNYDIFEDNIREMAYDEINELSDKDIRQIFNSILSSYDPLKWLPKWERTSECYSPPATFEDKREHIVETVLLNIQDIATSEELVYQQNFEEDEN